MKTFEQFDDPFGEEIDGNPIIPIDIHTRFEVGDQIYTREGKYRGTINDIEKSVDKFNREVTYYHFIEITDRGNVERRVNRIGLMMFKNKIKKK